MMSCWYPARSSVLPKEADLKTQLTQNIALNLPLLSAAMDTVTESSMAIALAQLGGLGVIHRNLSIERQSQEVRRVKKHESGNGYGPCHQRLRTMSISQVMNLMKTHQVSGVPVLDDGELTGIVTNRDPEVSGTKRQIDHIGHDAEKSPGYGQTGSGKRESSRFAPCQPDRKDPGC